MIYIFSQFHPLKSRTIFELAIKIYNLTDISNMNYGHHDYLKSSKPLENYYSNIPIDPKSTQIKKYSIFYPESKVLRTSLSSNHKPTARIRVNPKRKNLSSNLVTPATSSKKLSRAHASVKTVSILTSLPKLSKDHF